MINEDYIPLVIRELKGLKALADRAIVQLSVEEFSAVPIEGDNSVAIIVKHVSGNMLSRWRDFLASDGEKPNRDRDAEFELTPSDSRDVLLPKWEEAWAVLFGALAPLTTADLGRAVTIRGEQLSVLQAINRQLTHYAYHVGQIVYVAKHLAGSRWKSLSIPLGQSKQFNQAPAKYVR